MKEILFELDPKLPASLQAQLREKVVNAILSRALQPGERLPSSRSLSKHLKVARNTVTLAYQALADDGYLTPKARSEKIEYFDVDEGGMVLDEAKLAKCDIVFVTPSHQCPTTATMPIERRKKLMELAEKHDFVIIEDDYEFEMNFLAPPSPALKSMDEKARVIYIGSFSKSLFPGLRLGYLAGPDSLIEEARRLRHLIYRHPPGHSQRTAAYFMALGHYSSQMRKLKKKYAERRATMLSALEKNGLSETAAAKFGGTSFWIKGPKNLNFQYFGRKSC
ncbi:HTH-type transcriptional regulator TauR [Nymphon striatum]|nr:HTH-type transcriptional regulator TauR [Nymphon striatum]